MVLLLRKLINPALLDGRIRWLLQGTSSLLNVGAGSGSYEPHDLSTIAAKPSMQMISQHPDLSNVVQAKAEILPFKDGSFDATMAILTIHHWEDKKKGLEECARMARTRMVILTWDPLRWILACARLLSRATCLRPNRIPSVHPVPGEARFPLGHPDEKEGRKADEDVEGDAPVLMVVKRAKLRGSVEGRKDSFDFKELFIAKGDVLRSEAVVAGGGDVLPAEMFFFFDLCLVDDKGPILELSQIAPHGPVDKQGTDALLMGLPPLVAEGGERRFQAGDRLLSRCLILLGLFRVKDEGCAITSSSSSAHIL